jgi:hypothetical protein
MILEPDRSSTVILKAPAKLVVSTDPSSKETDDRTRTIRLGTSGSFFAASTIQIDASSQWARNDPAQRMLAMASWNPFAWIFAALMLIVTAMLSLLNDGLKAGLKRVLGLGRQAEKITEALGTAK